MFGFFDFENTGDVFAGYFVAFVGEDSVVALEALGAEFVGGGGL